MTKKLSDAEHPYRCATGNYYSASDCHENYDSWADYLDAWEPNDIDLNMIFRWDWDTPDPEDYEYEIEEDPNFTLPGPTLTIHRVLQRKAVLRSDTITINDEDEPAIRQFLMPYAQRMKELWDPLM